MEVSSSCDEKKINSLFKSLWPDVYSFIYYKVQNKEEAEELTQDTFSRVYPKIKSQKVAEEKTKSYIFSTAKNIITDLWRKRGRTPKTLYFSEEYNHQLSYTDKDYEDVMVLKDALEKLPTNFKKVITLRVIDGYSVKETSKKMSKTEGAVRSLQYRAIQSLKDILEKGGYFDEH